MSLDQNIARGLAMLGNFRARIVKWTGPASYATGGETMVGAGIATLEGVIPCGPALAGSSALQLGYDPSTGKLLAFEVGPAGGTPHVNAYVPGGADIKGSANTDTLGVGGAVPTNGNLVSTVAAANNTTPFVIAAQPDCARNISISLQNNTGGASAGNAADYVIVGTFRGAAQTETISFTAPDLATIANTSWGTKYGSKPFDTVTSITPSLAQPASWNHDAGIGSKLGLPTNLFTPIEADVVKISKNAADLPVAGLVDIVNMTVNLGTLANGDDVAIEYKDNVGVGGALVEVANTTNLSAFTARLLVLGK
jgi:hypothetical protein